MPKISVIVPVYNVEKYVGACFDSLLSQTSDDFEIIAVDDGSTDKSGEICDEYAVKNPAKITVVHQENKGLGGARNTGIEKASGEYLCFVDSDDTVIPETVEELCRAVDRFGCDVVLFAARGVSEDGKELSYTGYDAEDGKPFTVEEHKSILTGAPMACGRIVRASLFRDNGIRFPERVWYEDIRTTVKLMGAARTAVYLDRPFYNYLRREGSIMNNKNVERNREIIDAMEDLKEFFAGKGIYEKYRDELDFLTIDHVLVSATVRVLRSASPSHPLVGEFRSYTFENCRNIMKNPYVSAMPKNRKIILGLLIKKLYLPVMAIFRYIKK